MVSLSIPLFTGFGRVSRIKAAEEDLKSAELAKKQVIDGIIFEVKTNYYKALEEYENLRVAEKKKKYLQENYKAIEAKNKEGLATLTEVTDSLTKSLNSASEYQQSIFNYIISLSKLDNSIGGGR